MPHQSLQLAVCKVFVELAEIFFVPYAVQCLQSVENEGGALRTEGGAASNRQAACPSTLPIQILPSTVMAVSCPEPPFFCLFDMAASCRPCLRQKSEALGYFSKMDFDCAL